MKKHIFLALGLISLITACGESIYSGAENKTNNTAWHDKGDFAFIEGKCQEYIDMYQSKADQLKGDELYKYNVSLLSCSGLNVVNSLSSIFGTGDSKDPFSLIQGFMGVDSFTPEESRKLEESYKKILDTCSPMDSLNPSLQTICGMTAAADTIRMMGDVALKVSGGDSVSIDSDNMSKVFEGQNKDTIMSGVKTALNDNTTSINRNIEIISGASKTIEEQTKISDFSSNLNKFVGEVKGGQGKTDVTLDSLSSYLESKFAGTPGS